MTTAQAAQLISAIEIVGLAVAMCGFAIVIALAAIASKIK